MCVHRLFRHLNFLRNCSKLNKWNKLCKFDQSNQTNRVATSDNLLSATYPKVLNTLVQRLPAKHLENTAGSFNHAQLLKNTSQHLLDIIPALSH